MPPAMVTTVVTKKVLKMDQYGCDALLKRMLEDQKQEDEKRSIIQAERQAERNKLNFNHN